MGDSGRTACRWHVLALGVIFHGSCSDQRRDRFRGPIPHGNAAFAGPQGSRTGASRLAKAPRPGCESVIGDPFESAAYRPALTGIDTLVQLAGVSHPSPAKAQQFRSVDLRAAENAIQAARDSNVRHFVYISVAHPAPVMKDYIAVRSQVEEAIRAYQLSATILRPWYVLGPGRRWPLFLKPIYWALSALPATRDSARRLGLLTLAEMIRTMALAIEQPPLGTRILEVPQIRSIARNGMALADHREAPSER